jgi:hypothetical protein
MEFRSDLSEDMPEDGNPTDSLWHRIRLLLPLAAVLLGTGGIYFVLIVSQNKPGTGSIPVAGIPPTATSETLTISNDAITSVEIAVQTSDHSFESGEPIPLAIAYRNLDPSLPVCVAFSPVHGEEVYLINPPVLAEDVTSSGVWNMMIDPGDYTFLVPGSYHVFPVLVLPEEGAVGDASCDSDSGYVALGTPAQILIQNEGE